VANKPFELQSGDVILAPREGQDEKVRAIFIKKMPEWIDPVIKIQFADGLFANVYLRDCSFLLRPTPGGILIDHSDHLVDADKTERQKNIASHIRPEVI